jgi:hypothetical protein
LFFFLQFPDPNKEEVKRTIGRLVERFTIQNQQNLGEVRLSVCVCACLSLSVCFCASVC